MNYANAEIRGIFIEVTQLFHGYKQISIAQKIDLKQISKWNKKWGNEMNWIGILAVLMGVIYLTYSVLFRDKVNYYNRRFSRRNEMTIIKLSEFLRLQLNFSILNSTCCIISGMLIIIFNLNGLFILLVAIVFSLMNFLLVVKSKMKGYVDYKY
ncbi:hypothetical protein G9F71_022230 [Clostridium sp. FP2]|uniref:hypothetical protein n=1 Tax=Clostridium sp. FP2 TaxID=2724481 RepID=UPI001CCBFC5A|nr:hypothetical protein [Clostridium sp. FP2]MBZ9625551.1 hypothetical protein [Clostridium sp. FP2]